MVTPTILDDLDRKLLGELKSRLPMTHRPFQAIGQRIGLGEQECLERSGRLKRTGAFSAITAFFDPQALGYERALLAMKVASAGCSAALSELLSYPGLIYCCERQDPFSLWSTVWVPAQHSMPHLAKILHKRTQAEETLVLSALRIYKSPNTIAAASHPWLEAAHEHGGGQRGHAPTGFTDQDQRCVRVMQQDLPLLEMPFGVWAEQLELSEDALFDWCRRMEQQGVLSRLAAASAPSATSGGEMLVVWEVPDGMMDEVGAKMACLREVLHAAQRPVFPGWPYALFTVLHAASRDACEQIVQRIEGIAGAGYPSLLLPIVEEAACRPLHLCSLDMDVWWASAQEVQKT